MYVCNNNYCGKIDEDMRVPTFLRREERRRLAARKKKGIDTMKKWEDTWGAHRKMVSKYNLSLYSCDS